MLMSTWFFFFFWTGDLEEIGSEGVEILQVEVYCDGSWKKRKRGLGYGINVCRRKRKKFLRNVMNLLVIHGFCRFFFCECYVLGDLGMCMSPIEDDLIILSMIESVLLRLCISTFAEQVSQEQQMYSQVYFSLPSIVSMAKIWKGVWFDHQVV